ncbi:MAG: HD domain-containing protein, partial [Verrucomicrobia bacterium]|nr:HD domain-containing protein [Verrucomicrobiota bacterium]
MTDLQLQRIAEWFESYTGTFASVDGRFHLPLQLKVDHSRRVADNARQLAEDLGWNPEEANGAEALGWLHDVGRFS